MKKFRSWLAIKLILNRNNYFFLLSVMIILMSSINELIERGSTSRKKNASNLNDYVVSTKVVCP